MNKRQVSSPTLPYSTKPTHILEENWYYGGCWQKRFPGAYTWSVLIVCSENNRSDFWGPRRLWVTINNEKKHGIHTKNN